MVLKVLLFYCIVHVIAGKHVQIRNPSKVPLLKWVTNYSVEAKKYYMASSLIENFKYWRLDSRSRLDANDGAVIKIAIGTKSGKGKYEIHPETTKEETNKMVCAKSIPYPVMPDDILPNIGDLSERGIENVKGIDCIKFTNENQLDKNKKKTLLAYYDNSTKVWIPVRYKTKEIDEWHGYVKNYEIWDYFNFRQGVNPDIFNITYKCTNEKRSGKKKSTKHLLSSNTEENKSTPDEGTKKSKDPRREKPKKNGHISYPYSEKQVKEIAATLPKEYDLRLDGFVGPVINRRDCASDWAFAATAAVEGALARRSKEGTWIKLSEQALIDCSWGYGNKGCTSGHPVRSYTWIMDHGLPTEQQYGTYTDKNGFCKMENMTKTFKIKGYTKVTPFDIDALKIALINHGPVVVRVDSILSDLYDGGVYYGLYCKNQKSRSEYMAVVGYGEKDGDTFWILKNSKGPYSGIGGYIHISARDNNCGVMTEPTYVVA